MTCKNVVSLLDTFLQCPRDMMSANCESKLCARGPLAVFLIMFVVLVTDSYSAVQLLSLPSPMYFASYIIIFPLAIIAVVLYICTSIQGPGFVPLRWSPVSSLVITEYATYNVFYVVVQQ